MNMLAKKANGFTMLEMIVSVGVFATVAVLAVTSLLALTNAQKKALALQSVQDNLRFSIEAIARDLRQGDFLYCGDTLQDIPTDLDAIGLPRAKDCTGKQAITFVDRDNNVTTYRIGDASQLPVSSCGADHLCIEKSIRKGTDGTFASKYAEAPVFFPVTSLDIEINRFDLYVVGSDRQDQIEPRVTIVVEGIVGTGGSTSEFHLQTTISSHRNIYRD